jgi:hypothetical protein
MAGKSKCEVSWVMLRDFFYLSFGNQRDFIKKKAGLAGNVSTYLYSKDN